MPNFLNRVQKLQDSLTVDALLLEDPTDLFYLTGMDLSLGSLWAKPSGSILLVDARYIETCRKNCPIRVECTERKALADLIRLGELDDVQQLGFDASKTLFQTFEGWKNLLSQKKPTVKLVPLSSPLEKIRAQKDDEELQKLRDAATLGNEGFHFVLSLLKPGITETEVAQELEIFWRRKKAKGVAFDPIIAFGAHSSMPHYLPDSTPLKQQDSVLIDIGVTVNHYHSDMTRTVFIGDPSARWREIYEIVREAQARALNLCRPGTPMGDLDAAARGYIESRGFGPQFSHSLGHGIGLDVHEYPIIRQTGPIKNAPLLSGMVVTIEPGIYVPEFGGVRIEDTIVISEDGYENLTTPSKELAIL